MKWTIACAGAVVLVASLAACSSDEGAPGTSLPTGSSTSSTSSSSGGDADGGLNTGAVGCNADAECRSGHCFQGNMQHFCTLACTTDNATAVCEAPLTGTCNKQGFCKRD